MALPLLASSIFVYTFQDDLRNVIKNVQDKVYYSIYRDVEIDVEKSPKMNFALNMLLNDKLLVADTMLADDGYESLNYKLKDGTYKLTVYVENNKLKIYGNNEFNSLVKNQLALCNEPNNGQITKNNNAYYIMFIKKEGNKIWITCNKDIKQTGLRQFVDNIYKCYCSPQKMLTYYISSSNKWNFPIFRRPRNINKINITDSMQNVLDDFEEFKSMHAQHNYSENGYPYKRGYMLKGKPGTGKTTLVELFAMKYDMNVYVINLNSQKIDDGALIELVSNVPVNSLIVFEEIDRQIKTLHKNNNVNVSDGGILSAIDGPQRLSHGTVVVMTSNDEYKFSDEFNDALFRKGRIDKVFNLL